MQKASSDYTNVVSPLHLHVETLHPHRDSIMTLTDPIEPEEEKKVDKTAKVHSFTNHLAPLVLALYFIGHYLSNHAATSGFMQGAGGSVDVDPQFGGFVLIAAGLAMVKWSIDNAFLSPA